MYFVCCRVFLLPKEAGLPEPPGVDRTHSSSRPQCGATANVAKHCPVVAQISCVNIAQFCGTNMN